MITIYIMIVYDYHRVSVAMCVRLCIHLLVCVHVNLYICVYVCVSVCVLPPNAISSKVTNKPKR